MIERSGMALVDTSTTWHAGVNAENALFRFNPSKCLPDKENIHIRKRARPRSLISTFLAVQNDEQLRARYRCMRGKGHSHGRALRGIADRLLRVLVAMLRNGTLYDPTSPHRVGMVPPVAA